MSRSRVSVVVLAAVAGMLLAACTGGGEPAGSTIPNLAGIDPAPPPPELDHEAVEAGEAIYGQYCASCHAADLSGQPNWKTPNADGSYPAPPHDASGHTWHHSDQLLTQIVSVGLDVPGTQMPTFGDQLTDAEIGAVIEYLKSSWGPDERAFQWQVTWQESQPDS